MNKRTKTHPSQWDRFLDFAEKNPVVLTKKIDGPFGKEKYNQLWKDLTISMNSMGYVEKSTEKWQKAVADWKGKVRAKAAGIKLELSKTGGGGAGLQLPETEKRLIGVMGWTSIRGDGTLELRAPSTSTIPDSSELQRAMEHDYQFQVVPPKSRNVALSPPPPLIQISEENNVNRISTIPVERTNKKRKRIRQPINWHGNNSTLESMHEETLTILKEMNSNIKKLGDTQEKLCEIHTKLLDHLTTSIKY